MAGATVDMPSEPPSTHLPDPVLPEGWATPRYTTGLGDLDARIGGLGTGELWVVTSAPGQGRSTFLTQFATHLAVRHRVETWLLSSRDPAHVVSARAHAAVGRIPLSHLQDDRVDHSSTHLESARETLRDAPIRVVSHRHAAAIAHDEPRLHKPVDPIAVFFDDPDLEHGWDLADAHRLAQTGAVVAVTLPRERVLPGRAYHCDLEPSMRLADIVLEVRLHDLAAAEPDQHLDEPGLAAIAVIRNRRGPFGTVLAAFEGHYARFVDLRSRTASAAGGADAGAPAPPE